MNENTTTERGKEPTFRYRTARVEQIADDIARFVEDGAVSIETLHAHAQFLHEEAMRMQRIISRFAEKRAKRTEPRKARRE